MPQTKREHINIAIEPIFYEIVQRLVGRMNTTVSAYCRQLIVNDLRDRGLLTEELMTHILVGR